VHRAHPGTQQYPPGGTPRRHRWRPHRHLGRRRPGLDDTGAGLVGACFSLGSLLSAIGFIVAGIATVRARRWDGWRRYVPLATGISFAALIGLAVTPALAIAVALYGTCLTALGVALCTQPTPSTPRPRTEAVQVKL